MGLLIPPRPLTKQEFNAAISSGKRTLQEIDPRLWAWAGWYARWRYLRHKRSHDDQ